MSTGSLSLHFSRFNLTYSYNYIVRPEQIFNIDESGIPTRSAARARSKEISKNERVTDSVELMWAENLEHIKIIPVVPAEGKAWNPVIITQGSRPRTITVASNSCIEGFFTDTLAYFLPIVS